MSNTTQPQTASGTTGVSTPPPAAEANNTPQMPPYVASLTAMVAGMDTLMASYIAYGNQNTISTMSVANSDTSAALANLANIGEEMSQLGKAQTRESIFGVVGDICSDVLGMCVSIIDPILGMSLMGGQASGSLGITQDIVNGISSAYQDIFPDLTDSDCQALADITLVVAVVVAAVVVGVLTAGVGDEVMADVAVEDVGENVVEDAGKKVVKDVGSDLGTNQAKRGTKFGLLMGSQAVMQTDLAPNVIKGIASNTSNPDAQGWKYAEAAAFVIQTICCIGASIAGLAAFKGPSIIGGGTGEKAADSIIGKLSQFSRKLGLAAGIGEAFANTVAGAYSEEIANDYRKLSAPMANESLYRTDGDIANTSNQAIQKGLTDMEKALYDHSFASFGDAGGTVSQAMA